MSQTNNGSNDAARKKQLRCCGRHLVPLPMATPLNTGMASLRLATWGTTLRVRCSGKSCAKARWIR